MNNLLSIKLTFNHEKNKSGGGSKNLKKTKKVESSSLSLLIANLETIKNFYSGNKYVKRILIDVYYDDIICKTGRIQELFHIGSEECNDYIVGARFSDGDVGHENHIITYYVSREIIDLAISKLAAAKRLIDEQLNGVADYLNFDATDKKINYSKYSISKNKIRDAIIDSSVIEKFDIPKAASEVNKERIIITFYQTEANLIELFNSLGYSGDNFYYYCVGKNTYSVSHEVYNKLLAEVPYMISMATSDISSIHIQDSSELDNNIYSAPLPNNEPTIGVIDTLFDKRVYFNQWVDYKEELEFYERGNLSPDSYNHGTAVTSLIVDGPTLNPELDDGCGRFKVRHFGVCTGQITPTRLIKKIEKIVNENPDIHVRNLSLGTEDEVAKNFISFDSSILDEIQSKKNVIFVVSGTNDVDRDKESEPYKRVGSPADSLNSIVVNSVKRDGTPALYTRAGKILSFYKKPDISYYGGDYNERINVYTNRGIEKQCGTSFAAPRISRKLCYLIDVLGFSREIAKALLIDSAAGWDYASGRMKFKNEIGYGIAPIRIENILECDSSEIRFVVQGTANSYHTTNYGIPVPNDEKMYYVARATLCYFPECDRLQGVDYTQRELSIRLGRIKDEGIKDINENTQEDPHSSNSERKSRAEFRKRDNTKFISNKLKEGKAREFDVYNGGLWGLAVTSKERRRIAKQDNLNFGVVVTLKHTKGFNKINDFVHSCLLRGYLVNEIKIKNRIEIYEKAQEEIKFD